MMSPTICAVAMSALTTLISVSSVAFPAVFPISVHTVPWAPSPHEHTFLAVRDSISGVQNGADTLVGAELTVSGSVIAVNATLAEDLSGTGQGATFQIDLGVLAVGRYTINYSATTATLRGGVLKSSLIVNVTSEGYATAVEYFAPSLEHYFITADAGEIAALDAGTIGGWVRTGQAFHVIPSSTEISQTLPVCRFYGLPSAGLNSHFFSDAPDECASIQADYPQAWILETNDAFFAVPTDYWNSICPSGSVPLYRLYNNRADANHRYTTSAQIRDQMIAMGWLQEGNGAPAQRDRAVGMCVGE